MFETHSTWKCCDEENHILHRTSQCAERRLTGNRFFIRNKHEVSNVLYFIRKSCYLSIEAMSPVSSE